jgi:hypothetical protein
MAFSDFISSREMQRGLDRHVFRMAQKHNIDVSFPVLVQQRLASFGLGKETGLIKRKMIMSDNILVSKRKNENTSMNTWFSRLMNGVIQCLKPDQFVSWDFVEICSLV